MHINHIITLSNLRQIFAQAQKKKGETLIDGSDVANCYYTALLLPDL